MLKQPIVNEYLIKQKPRGVLAGKQDRMGTEGVENMKEEVDSCQKKKHISQNNNSVTTSSVLNNMQCFTNNII